MEINDAEGMVMCDVGSDQNFHSFLWGLSHFPQWKEVQMEYRTPFQKILTRHLVLVQFLLI